LPNYAGPAELVLLVIVLVSALMAIKILLDLASKHHRSRYTRMVRLDLGIGIVLGLSLPWIEPVGLMVAAMTAVLFLGLSIIMLLESKRVPLWRMRTVRRERIKEWYLHFSVTTGLVGIVTTLLSIVVPPFLKLSLGFMVPLAFDSLSVLSALLEFTLPSTPYHVIYALIFGLVHERTRKDGTTEIRLDDLEQIAHETAHSRFEVLDTVESLVEQGLATKNDNGFVLDHDGTSLLKLTSEEMSARIRIQLDHVEAEIASLSTDQASGSSSRLDIINRLSESVSDLKDECGFLVDEKRTAEIRQRLVCLRKRSHQ